MSGLFRLAGSDDAYVAKGHMLKFGRALASLLPAPVTPDGSPAYALLTGWNDAHLLLWATGRAVAVSSFGTPEAYAVNRTAFRLLLSNDEETCIQEMEKASYRVIVVSSIFDQVQDMAAIAGSTQDFMSSSLRTDGRDLFMYYEPRMSFWGTLHTRLFLGDGTARSVQDQALQPLSHARLVLESDYVQTVLGQPTAAFKAFEVVGGATLMGRATPGEKVFLRLTVQTNVGRTFLYEREAAVDSSGNFSLVVPYSTDGSAPVHSVGPYRLKIGERVSHLTVTDEAVRRKRAVDVFSGTDR